MRNILVTGGTVFVSRYIAEYFVKKGDKVYVLNRNTKEQSQGVILIEKDKNNLGDELSKYNFDVVLDMSSYTKQEVESIINSLGEYSGEYIFVSSSAVYPETNPMPCREEDEIGSNIYWGKYGVNKIEAEEVLKEKMPQAYILRPAYIYGPMQNLYREPFVFDCAKENRPFFIPKDGEMKLQFSHIEDIARLIETILDKKPENKIYNVGDEKTFTIKEWVELCYKVLNKEVEFISVDASHKQFKYFPFMDYEYEVDVTKQKELIGKTKDLFEGLKESYEWYINNEDKVRKAKYMMYIENEIK